MAAYKIFEVIKRIPKIDASSMNGRLLEDLRGEIDLRNLYFRYPARPNVQIFTRVSLHIRNGTTTALVGHSGSGNQQ